MLDMDIIDHVAALGPESVLTNLTRGRSARRLACPSRSARPRKCLNQT